MLFNVIFISMHIIIRVNPMLYNIGIDLIILRFLGIIVKRLAPCRC